MKTGKILAILALPCILASCNQKDLCEDHWEHAPKLDFNVNIDWQLDWQYTYPGGTDWAANWNEPYFGCSYNSLRPSKPDGVRLMVYNKQGENSLYNIGPDGGKAYMAEGVHDLLFFNNDTEYIIFSDLYSVATAKATTRAKSRITFIAGNSPVKVPGSDYTVGAPDPLFGHFIKDFDAERKQETQHIDITMKPLTFKYLVRYNFDHGFEYVAMARGAMLGMAASVYLSDGRTGDDVATILYDCEVKDGYIEAVVGSFGAPNYPNSEYSRADNPYALNLEVRLKNGIIKNFNFDITEQVRKQPRGGVIEVGGIDIPDSEGNINGGGFDVEIEGWGDYIDIPIM